MSTKVNFLSLAPALTALTRHAAVLEALDGPADALAEALLAREQGADLYRALGGAGEPSPEGMAPLLDGEALRWLRLCAQCSGTELLAALALCPGTPSPEALAALVERHRRQDAMALYALQMLWRLCGEGDAIPDAMALFAQEEANPALEQLACRYVIDQLKGGDMRG